MLTSELFDSVENYSDIYTFMCLAAKKDFQIVYVEESEKFEKFKKHFNPSVMNTVLQKIEKDLKLFVSRKSAVFKIGMEKSKDFITINEAIDLVTKPFEVCMENNRNDKNFLYFFCDDEQKKLLKNLEQNNELYFWSGGGTGELKKRVEKDDFRIQNSYVFFDSDQLPFDSTSIGNTPNQIKTICEKKNTKFSILQRRFIESYVPHKSLSTYVFKNKKNKKAYQSLLDAYIKLDCKETQYYFNMKKGLNGDEKRACGRAILIEKYFYKIPRNSIKFFNTGFGENLSSVYEDDLNIADKIKDSDGWNEINGIVKNILMVI
jgi:hypothetical protein